MTTPREIVLALLEQAGDQGDNLNDIEDLPKIYVYGIQYAVDAVNLRLIDCANPETGFEFDTEDELWDFVESETGMDTDAVTHHVYEPRKQEPEPPPIPMERKLRHEVFRYGNFVILKLPAEHDFIRREGISMKHCLSVAYVDYCKRMASGEVEQFSLTDLRDGEPRVNFELSLLRSSYGGPVTKPCITQIRGIRNECPPKDEYLEPIMAFFRTKDWIIGGHGIRSFDGGVDGDKFLRRYREISGHHDYAG